MVTRSSSMKNSIGYGINNIIEINLILYNPFCSSNIKRFNIIGEEKQANKKY